MNKERSKNTILIHSIVFSPDSVSTAYLYNDIALRFKEENYNVEVLTTTPHYNINRDALSQQPLKKRWGGLFYESDYNGIRVTHIPQKKHSKTLLRMLGFIHWHIMAFILAMRYKQINLILSPSPPLTIAFLNIIISTFRKSKTIYNVQEIYPDFLIQKLGLKPSSITARILKWLERFIYNHSNAVTTIDQVFYDIIISRFKAKDKLSIIPNFVDTKLYRPLSQEATIQALDKTIFPPMNGVLKIMYAGNIGHAQDWLPLINLADQLKSEKVHFFIIGEGSSKEYLRDQINLLKLDNISLIDYQPREQMPYLIAYADIHFIFMSKAMENHGFPSKVYTIMACGKPMLIMSGEGSPIINFLTGKNCSYNITSDSLEHKVSLAMNFLTSITNTELKEMGMNGLNIVTQQYSSNVVTLQYCYLVDKLLIKK